jgi:DNA-binding LacI/PurR family transcriptional regulator
MVDGSTRAEAGMAVRLVDVARHAGVAPSTVSHVLSGKRPISAETRRRVEASIDALGFMPHAGAQSIRSQSTGVVALVLPMRTDSPGWLQMRFVIAALDAARERDMNLMLLTAEDGVAAIRNVVNRAMVDGVIVMEIEFDDRRMELLERIDRPSVLIGTPREPTPLIHVDFDFAAAGALCVEHLYGLGHRHIGFVGHSQALYNRKIGYALRARSGVMDALGERGLRQVWSPAEPTAAGAAAALETLLAQDPAITALIVYNELAFGPIMERLAQLGRAVPRDMSVVTIGQDDQAPLGDRRLSNVPIPAAEMGRAAFERLTNLITKAGQPSSTLLEPHLERHGSATSSFTAPVN